ncbi:hypothetical protein [Candidatus Galacturonibacter soehngenii]|uniref:Outer membrane protein assembly factor BamE n=1 Tax=Candidatus Galacturonatibacter soehngenii TaxID=2307010 RepID=A0A7V7UCD3_9FIRM|nr:hypothetical protein [Candidatus Galacturonibacter soehngenii]KAB1438690.1 hypothetical protein F7O84_14290 [Candidatus Galacturonibacter soehngenii]
MKKYKIIILMGIMLLSLLIVSCKSNNKENDTANDNTYKLTKNMIKNDVDELLGEPKEDIGSGLSVYIYRIDDVTILTSYDSEERLISATLQKNDGTEEQLIE